MSVGLITLLGIFAIISVVGIVVSRGHPHG